MEDAYVIYDTKHKVIIDSIPRTKTRAQELCDKMNDNARISGLSNDYHYIVLKKDEND